MKMQGQQLKRAIAALTLTGYIMFAVFGLFLMVGHMSHGSMPMQNCPYMAGEHVVCPMDSLLHIEMWQKQTLAIPLEVLFLLASIAVFVLQMFRPPDRVGLAYVRYRKRNKIIPPLTLLFADGLLNPKVP